MSRVVPEIGVTIFLSSPINALIREDFPTFGFPTIANFGTPDVSSSSGFTSKSSVTLSNISPVPLPLIEERLNTSPNPRL